MFGITSLMSLICSTTGDMSERPVTLPPGFFRSLTSCAPTGSESGGEDCRNIAGGRHDGLRRWRGDRNDHIRAFADELARDLCCGCRVALCGLIDELEIFAFLVSCFGQRIP